MRWLFALIALLLGLAVGFFLAPGGVGRGAVESVDASAFASTFATNANTNGATGSGSAHSEAATAAEGAITVEWLESVNDLDAFDQIGALHERLRSINPAEFPGLMDELGELTGSAVNWQLRTMIATRWAQLDPQGMLAYSKKQNEPMSWSLYNTVFGAWSKQDPQAAYDAALQLDDQRAQQAGIQAVLNTIAETSPQRAIRMAREYFGNDLSGRGRWIFQSIYSNWAQRDGEAARQSALSLEEGAAKSAALAGAMSGWMAEDPVEALAWLDSLPMDSAVYGSRKTVFRNFLNRDFDVAREYIDSLEDPVDRRKILENLQFHNLAWQRSYEEIEGIFDWLGTVATGQVYDSRVSGILGAMAKTIQTVQSTSCSICAPAMHA
jgi:hypothetical protein